MSPHRGGACGAPPCRRANTRWATYPLAIAGLTEPRPKRVAIFSAGRFRSSAATARGYIRPYCEGAPWRWLFSGITEIATPHTTLLPDLAKDGPGFAYGATVAPVLVGLTELAALVLPMR